MLCFVPVLTSDLLPIPFKQFLLQRTLGFLESKSTLSPRNFALILLVSKKSSLFLTPSPPKDLILKANYSPLLASLAIFAMCAALGERSYAAHWMSPAKLTIRPTTFHWITPSTRISCVGEFSSHPGMVVTSTMTTNRPLRDSWIFTPTHASLASVPLSQATDSTALSRTRRPLLPFNYFQGPLRHYCCGQNLGSIPCLSQYSVPLR